MKKIFNKCGLGGMVAITLMLLTSNCTKLTNGLSTDPVNVTDPHVIDESKYMSGAQVILVGIFEGDQARQTGMWADYFDGEDRQYAGLQNYVTTGQDYDNEWVNIYTSLFKNTQLLKQNARPTKNFVAIGVAQVMEAMSIGLAASMWGDVPYSQITQYPVIANPVFDSQASVYAAAQSLLDSAITNLGLSGSAPGDFLLSGNASAWIAAAHTVKARLYLHTRDYTNAITQALSGIGSANGNIMAPHGSAYLQTFNLYYSFLTYDRSGYMAANCYAPKLLDSSVPGSRNNAKTDETARLNYLYYPGSGLNFAATPGTYEPNVQCDFDWGNPTNQNGFFGGTTAFPILTFQENTLILAEAYMKQSTPDPVSALAALNSLRAYYNTGAHVNSGYTTTSLSGTITASSGSILIVGDAKTKFTTELAVNAQLVDAKGNVIGTVASIADDHDLTLTKNSAIDLPAGSSYQRYRSVYLPYVYADFAPGGIDNNGTDSQSQALLREILQERYVTLIGQIEGWNDMRRTGNFLNLPLPAGKTQYPLRGLYSQIEQNTNPNCYKLVNASGYGLYEPVPAFSSPY